jgi:hypothetical protein
MSWKPKVNIIKKENHLFGKKIEMNFNFQLEFGVFVHA